MQDTTQRQMRQRRLVPQHVNFAFLCFSHKASKTLELADLCSRSLGQLLRVGGSLEMSIQLTWERESHTELGLFHFPAHRRSQVRPEGNMELGRQLTLGTRVCSPTLTTLPQHDARTFQRKYRRTRGGTRRS